MRKVASTAWVRSFCSAATHVLLFGSKTTSQLASGLARRTGPNPGAPETSPITRAAVSRASAAWATAGQSSSTRAASSSRRLRLPKAPELVAKKAYGSRHGDRHGCGRHLVQASGVDQERQHREVHGQRHPAHGEEARVLVMGHAVCDAKRPYPVPDEVARRGNDERDRERDPVRKLGVQKAVHTEVDDVSGCPDQAVAHQFEPVVGPANPDVKAFRMRLEADVGRFAADVLHPGGS